MKILVFVSKWIGAKCLNILFSNFNDDYLFVVSGQNSDEIIKLIRDNNHKYMLLNERTIKYINSKGNHHYDWLLNLWGGYIFDESMILKARYSLNIHPSFLPFGKGRDPVVWAIRNGHPAGVTLHQITSEIDEGPIIYQEEVEYNFPITGGELYKKVVERCWMVFNEQWPYIRQSTLKPKLQKPNNNVYKRNDLMKDRLIDLDSNKVYRDLFMRIMAHDFGNEYCANIKYNEKIYVVRFGIKEEN